MSTTNAEHLKYLIDDIECPPGCHCSELAIAELPGVLQVMHAVFLCEGHHEHPCVHRVPDNGYHICGCLRRTRLRRDYGI